MSDQYKYLLDEKALPKAWYNINPDMPVDPAKTAWNSQKACSGRPSIGPLR